MTLILRPAEPVDTDGLMALRRDAEHRLALLPTDQWSDPDTGGRSIAKWRADIDEGRTWVVEAGATGGTVLATVTLPGPDRDFWQDADDPGAAVYISKLIVSRAAKGRQLGGRLMDWAGEVARSRGLPWIRLDAWRDNRRLHEYYLRHGFTHVRSEQVAGRKSGWMAQRSSAVVVYPDQELTVTELHSSA